MSLYLIDLPEESASGDPGIAIAAPEAQIDAVLGPLRRSSVRRVPAP